MNSIENIMKLSMEHVRNLIDANTIIGTPIALPSGGTVIPVSKVAMGLLSGGSDIPAKTPIKTSAQGIFDYPFAGTAVTGMTLTPVSFIVVNDDIKVLPVDYKSSVDRLIDTILPVVDKVAGSLKGNCE